MRSIRSDRMAQLSTLSRRKSLIAVIPNVSAMFTSQASTNELECGLYKRADFSARTESGNEYGFESVTCEECL